MPHAALLAEKIGAQPWMAGLSEELAARMRYFCTKEGDCSGDVINAYAVARAAVKAFGDARNFDTSEMKK